MTTTITVINIRVWVTLIMLSRIGYPSCLHTDRFQSRTEYRKEFSYSNRLILAQKTARSIKIKVKVLMNLVRLKYLIKMTYFNPNFQRFKKKIFNHRYPALNSTKKYSCNHINITVKTRRTRMMRRKIRRWTTSCWAGSIAFRATKRANSIKHRI